MYYRAVAEAQEWKWSVIAIDLSIVAIQEKEVVAENVVQDARDIDYTFDGKIILHMMTWYGVV